MAETDWKNVAENVWDWLNLGDVPINLTRTQFNILAAMICLEYERQIGKDESHT